MGKPRKKSQPTDEQSPGKNQDRKPNASQKDLRAPSSNEQHATGNAPLIFDKVVIPWDDRRIAGK